MTAHPPLSVPVTALDRAAEERASDDIVERARAEAGTLALALARDAAPLATPQTLAWMRPDEVPSPDEWAFLGRRADGRAVLAAVYLDDAPPFSAPAGWGGLRAVGAELDPAESAVFVEALSLARWLRDAAFCPACGSRAVVCAGGWSRQCPSCGREHFPRTDPAVIAAVTHPSDPDLLLLGSNILWEHDRFSCFAGFVEAGESLEDTVVRELHEEAGVALTAVRYHGSQAWPYPRSLMVGFFATALDAAAARPDGEEIVAVRWFHRDEIGAALEGKGEVRLPGPASISRRIIEDWYGGAA
ncbi:NAD(+) diphosphatase [Microbacterium xanthum]|uniref:NAD(+) diphosphatase n=1 Tax=Microbacterium xanthum TaxID=3079794 RepID=UPI002AD31AC2|nr:MULTISPECIES: NAD(+) diphosphatase [unclassified Microbacterium]MDZ8172164.1 NAD(+) diphosphatase [Microbacterium sp. KSW-48]MDZ8202129.1 NAD(+) diphosphatase [Microbacterium sp. SSW1-59]